MDFTKSLLRNVGITVVVAGLTYGITSFMPKTYQSNQTLYFPLSQSPASGAGAALARLSGGSADAGDVAGISNLRGALQSPLVASGLQSATAILTSDTAYQYVIKKLDLAKRWNADENDSIAHLGGMVRVKADKNGLLNIEVSAESPELAKDIVEGLYTHLQSRANDLTLNVSRKNRILLEQRVAENDEKVNVLRNDMVAAMEGAGYSDVDLLKTGLYESKKAADDAKTAAAAAQSKIQKIESDYRRLLAQAKDGKLEASSALQGVSAESGQALDSLSKELQTRRIALEDASSRFTKDSAEYRNAVATARSAEKVSSDLLQSSQNQVDQGLVPTLVEAKGELAALQASVRFSERRLREYEGYSKAAPRKYATVEEAKTKYQGALKMREYLRSELELAKIAENRDPARFEVVDKARVDDRPVAPRKALITGAVALLAFFVLCIPLLKQGFAAASPD